MKGLQSWKFIALVLGLAVLAILVMDFNSRMGELRRLTSEREVVAARATRAIQTQQALETQIAYATSEAAVSEWAYEDAHMIRPGDYPVVPMPAGGALTTPSPTPTPPPRELENWEYWWEWLFGKR